MAFSSAFEREEEGAAVTYTLQDDVRFQGGFGGFGLSYRLTAGSRVEFLARTTAGLISARSADPIRARVTKNQESAEVYVAGRSQVVVSQPGFVMPEVGLEVEWTRIRLGLLLGLLLVLPDGPTYRAREMGLNPALCTGSDAIGCTPNSGILAGEHPYGLFQVWIPQFTVGYTFEPVVRRRIRR